MPTVKTSYEVPEEVLSRLRGHAFQAERDGQLHPQQLVEIYEQRWFKMFVPKSFGGLELSLPEVLRTEEKLAWADGSTAWVVTLCSGAGWFIGFIDPKITGEIFSSNKVCLAGSGATTGTASPTRDGFVVNGRWKYASGALHATMLTVNCILMNDGYPLLNEDGTPVVKSFILRKDEVELQLNWNSIGMIATAGHSFDAKEVHVPKERSFIIHQDKARLPLPVYQYPFLQLAETTLAVNFLGLAQRFLELFGEILQTPTESARKHNVDVVSLYTEKQQTLLNARMDFYKAVDTSWSYCVLKGPIPDVVLEIVSKRSRALYWTSLSIASSLYPYAGMTAADPRTEINRVWRNLYTASQHALFTR